MVENKTIICKSFKDFNTFINTYQQGKIEVAYDVETNAKDVHSADHRVIGFSIAFDEFTGCYVPIKALDFELTPTDKRLIEKRLKMLLTNSTSLVYNCMHEYPATLSWLDLELPKVDDLFVMVKLMMGNADEYKGNGGLKIQSVMHLGYDNWSDDVQIYFKYLRELTKYEKSMRKLLLQYYDATEIDGLIAAMYNIPEEALAADVISYEYIPYKVVGTYGSLDSTVLFELRDFYRTWMKKESTTLNIDLTKGYQYWMNHHYAGYILERNGAYWDDEKASEVEDWCKTGMIESLSKLILHPLTQEYIEKNLANEYLSYLLTEHAYVLSPEYVPVKINKTSLDVICKTTGAELLLSNMSLQPKVTKKYPEGKYHLALGNFKTIVDLKRNDGNFDDKEIYKNFLKSYIRTMLKTKDVEKLKTVFNPGQVLPAFYDFLNKVLVTEDIRIAKMYFDIIALTEEPEFDMDFYKDFYDMASEQLDNYPKYAKNFNMSEFKKNYINYSFLDSADSKLISFVLKIKNSDHKDKFRLFKKQFELLSNTLKSKKLCKTILAASNLKYDSFDDDSVIALFELYEFIGVNIEDKSTWTDSFVWLYYFRWYKKYSKLLSTYIYGAVGRSSVWLVPKDKFESGEAFTKRVLPYYSNSKKKIRNLPENIEDYDMVLQTPFLVNMADSGRWKATMHTMPAGNTIKGIVQSRYKGGIIAMPDCSQAEVRILARAAKDDNLINAFRQGLDIHRYVASLTNNKPMEEVTSTERKVAKSAVFGLLYGETEQAFADEHFGGDLNKALEVYDYFYKAFPNVKGYIDSCHKNYDEYKKAILTVTDRYIDMSRIKIDQRDKSKIYRQSQNFPIQGCVLGNTMIKCLDGQSKMIKDLTSEEKFYVYSYNKERNKIVPSIGYNAHITKEVTDLYKITFDNDKSITCTGNHPIMLRNGNYLAAEELSVGMSIMPMYWHYTEKDEFTSISQGYEVIDQISGNKELTHRLVTEEFGMTVPQGFSRHHKDHNKTNNVPDNLEVLSRSMHMKLHANLLHDISEKLKNNIPLTDFEQQVWNNCIDGLDKGRETEYQTGILSTSMAEKNRNRKDLYPEWYANQRKSVIDLCNRDDNPFKIADKAQRATWRKQAYQNETEEQTKTRLAALKKGHNTESAIKNHADASVLREADPMYNFNRITKQLELMHQLNLDWSSMEVWDSKATKKILKDNGFSSYSYRSSKTINKIGYDLFIELATEHLKNYNHKITKIEIIHYDTPVPVYDLTVPGYDNFVIDLGDNSGVVVHNSCVDVAGLILYMICLFIKKESLKSKPFCFIHDSIEIDIHPDETFLMLDKLKPLFNEYPDKEFEVPMASDIVFSCNMGSEIEVCDMQHDDQYNDVTITLKGFESDINDVINTWKSVYYLVEKDESFEETSKDSYVSLRGLFMKKVVISKEMGTTKKEVKQRYHILRKKS